MTFPRFRTAPLGLALGGLLALTACGGVGEGTLPVKSTLLPLGGTEGASSTKAYSCLNTSVQLIVEFNNGARGDFTGRASWSSSNPSIVQVSNGDLPVPEQEGRVYPRGVVVPVAPGTATIQASYLDFRNSIEVVVTDPTNFRIEPATADLAVGSSLDLAASADLDGVSSPIDALVRWAMVTEDATIATIGSDTGLVTGVAKGGPLTARARIPGCSFTAEVPVNVSPLVSLSLSKEFADRDRLVVGTTERITATGTLENGQEQDLSGQVIFSSSDSTAIGFLVGTARNLVIAIKSAASPVELGASFGVDPAKVTAPVLPITAIDGSLSNVSIDPISSRIAPGGGRQLKALGEYSDGLIQDITRHVVWTSADASTVTVLSSSGTINVLAGLATASRQAETGDTVEITASNSAATGRTSAVSTLTVDPSAPSEP